MLRDSDIQRRDGFFKKAQDTVKKMSGLDLSMPENVQAAYQVFQPLIDDTNIASDMSLTKGYMNELQHAEGLRHSLDPKVQKTYWNEGVQDMNNWADDYKRTDDQQALRFPGARYVPNVDEQELVNEAIKGMGFKITGTSFMDAGPGTGRRYQVTTSNGTRMIVPLEGWLYGAVGSDPRVQDKYAVKARLANRSEVDQLLPRFGGDRNQAEDYFYGRMQSEITSLQSKTLKKLGYTTKEINTKLGMLSNKIDNLGGVKSDNPVVQEFIDFTNQQRAVSQATQTTSQYTLDPQSMLSMDKMNRRISIDNAMGNALLHQVMYSAAATYSMLTAETKMEPDKYALLNYADSLKRMDMQQEYKYKKELLAMKQGATASQDPGYSPKFGNTGSAGKEDAYAARADIRNDYLTPFKSHMDQAIAMVYKDLANKADYGDANNPHQQDDALSQLNAIFGKSLIDNMKVQHGGKLSNANIYDEKAYTDHPNAFYESFNNQWKDKTFRLLYPGIISSVGPLKGNADIEAQAAVAVAETDRNNNRIIAKAVQTTNLTPVQKQQVANIVGPNGEVLDRFKYNALWKGTAPLEVTDKIYHESLGIFKDMFNSGGIKGIKPLSSSPYLPAGVGGSASMASMTGEVNPRLINSSTTRDAIATVNSLDNLENIYGISTLPDPNMSNDKNVSVPGTPEYERKAQVLKEYTRHLMAEAREKPSNHKVTDAGIDIHTKILSGDQQAITISPSQDFFDWYNKKYKGSESSKTGLKYDDFKNMTVIYNKGKSPSEIFDRFKYGPVDRILQQGKSVSINQFPDDGHIYLHRNSKGAIDITGSYTIKADEDGKSHTYSAEHLGENWTANGDIMYKMFLDKMETLHNYNIRMLPLSPDFMGPIKTAQQAAALAQPDSEDE